MLGKYKKKCEKRGAIKALEIAVEALREVRDLNKMDEKDDNALQIQGVSAGMALAQITILDIMSTIVANGLPEEISST